MDVDLVFKIAAVGILVSAAETSATRSGRGGSQATMTTLAGLIVVLMMVVQKISRPLRAGQDLFGL